MFNLMRMDLRRARKSKSTWILLVVLLLGIALADWTMKIVVDPELRQGAIDMGFEITAKDGQDFEAVLQTSNAEALYQMIFQGGVFFILLYLLCSLLVCTDLECGFAKNIFSLVEQRWKYLVSKLLTIQLISAFYLTAAILFHFLVCQILNLRFVSGSNMDFLKFALIFWVAGAGFVTQAMVVCILTRSKAAAVAAAILIPGGVVVSLMNQILSLFGIYVADKTLYGCVQGLDFPITGSEMFSPLLVSLVWLGIWLGSGIFLLHRKDIA